MKVECLNVLKTTMTLSRNTSLVFLAVLVMVGVVAPSCLPPFLARLKAEALRTQPIKAIHEVCQADPRTHRDDEVIARFRKGEETEADRAEAGRHNLCMNMHLGIQKENGDIDFEGLRRFIIKEFSTHEARVEKLMAACGTRQPGSSAGEAAITLAKCVDVCSV